MANSTRYYQLTKDILLEYVYVDTDNNTAGNVQDRLVDLQTGNKLYIVDNNYDGKRYLTFRDNQNDNKIGNNYGNFVVSLNRNDTKFVKVESETIRQAAPNTGFQRYTTVYQSEFTTEAVNFSGNNTGDMYFDKCILHFTGSNYFGDYESLVFQAFVRDLDGSKISLANILFKRTDFVELDDKPLLINQRVYTTHISFRIPSVEAMFNTSSGQRFMNKISRCSVGVNNRLERNTPVEFNVLGVKSDYSTGGFLFLNTIQLNSITVPYFDSYKKVTINIEEADDGDYFRIYANVNNGSATSVSFSDYMSTIDENVSNYIIMHEINLYEKFVFPGNTEPTVLKTHSEYYLVNMSFNEDDNEIDDVITFRPVCLYSNMDESFEIEDILSIINTEDNTTVVKISSRTFSGSQVHKYGRRMGNIFTDNEPVNINVYNRRADEDLDYVHISRTGGSGNPTVENHQYHISSLVECTNIGVSIQQMSSFDVESNI